MAKILEFMRSPFLIPRSTLTKKDTSEGDDTKGLADANTEREETQANLGAGCRWRAESEWWLAHELLMIQLMFRI